MRECDGNPRGSDSRTGSLLLAPVVSHADKVALRRASCSSQISSRFTRGRTSSGCNSSSIYTQPPLKRGCSKQSDLHSRTPSVEQRRSRNEVSRRTHALEGGPCESESAVIPASALVSSGCRPCLLPRPCRSSQSACAGLVPLWRMGALWDKLTIFFVAILGCLLMIEGAVGLVIEEPFQENFYHV